MVIELPALHPGQRPIIEESGRFNVCRWGRRTGKTTMGEILACETAIDGFPVGWFSPSYKYLTDVMREINRWLGPLIAKADMTEKRFELKTGGVIEFWTLENKEAGRSRKYKRVVIDEAGIVPDLLLIWQQSIRPTLTDYLGDAWFLGTPRGRREFHQMFEYAAQGKKGWKSFQIPTSSNPLIDPQEIADAKAELPPDVFAQEFEGTPMPDGGCPYSLEAIAAAFGKTSTKPTVCYGVDLAKSQDWTVLIGMDDTGIVTEFERWQGIPWSSTIDRLSAKIGNLPALIDSTGVGDPIVEQLQRVCPMVQGYLFSSPSKQKLCEGLAVGLQKGEIGFTQEVMRSELEQFGYEYTATGVRYSAPDGMTDDCVCALGLCYYGLTMRPRPHTYCGEEPKKATSIPSSDVEASYEAARNAFASGADDDE